MSVDLKCFNREIVVREVPLWRVRSESHEWELLKFYPCSDRLANLFRASFVRYFR